jgi:hypothetical protein
LTIIYYYARISNQLKKGEIVVRTQDLENIKKAELLVMSSLPYVNLFNNGTPEIYALANALCTLYFIDCIGSYYTYKLTSDYRQIKVLYSNVISSMVNLANEFGFKDPVELFSMFVYLYRNGYLSYTGEFTYNMNLKDLPGLGGADVIRGKGVCRNLASMFTDLSLEFGFNATSLAVCATKESVVNQQKLCDTPINKSGSNQKLLKTIADTSIAIGAGNHLISQINYNGHNYLLDPTNDGMLRYDKDSKRLYVGNPDNHMRYVPTVQLFNRLLGNMKTYNLHTGFDNPIDEETYREIYTRTLVFLKDNVDIIQEFSKCNHGLYEELYNLLDDQRSIFGRMFPVVPRKSTIERFRKYSQN